MSPASALVLCFSTFFEGRQNHSKMLFATCLFKMFKNIEKHRPRAPSEKVPLTPPCSLDLCFAMKFTNFQYATKTTKKLAIEANSIRESYFKEFSICPLAL